jgi:hypothetical protein
MKEASDKYDFTILQEDTYFHTLKYTSELGSRPLCDALFLISESSDVAKNKVIKIQKFIQNMLCNWD